MAEKLTGGGGVIPPTRGGGGGYISQLTSCATVFTFGNRWNLPKLNGEFEGIACRLE